MFGKYIYKYKIMRSDALIVSVLLIVSSCTGQQKNNPSGGFNPEEKQVIVYTTARDTNLRLTPSETKFRKLESTSER